MRQGGMAFHWRSRRAAGWIRGIANWMDGFAIAVWSRPPRDRKHPHIGIVWNEDALDPVSGASSRWFQRVARSRPFLLNPLRIRERSSRLARDRAFFAR
jgi:hypothetical protein